MKNLIAGEQHKDDANDNDNNQYRQSFRQVHLTAQGFVGRGECAGAPGGSVSVTVEVSIRHSSQSLSSSSGLSSQRTLNSLFGNFGHERQKCQMFSVGLQRYSMDTRSEAQTLCCAITAIQNLSTFADQFHALTTVKRGGKAYRYQLPRIEILAQENGSGNHTGENSGSNDSNAE